MSLYDASYKYFYNRFNIWNTDKDYCDCKCTWYNFGDIDDVGLMAT